MQTDNIVTGGAGQEAGSVAAGGLSLINKVEGALTARAVAGQQLRERLGALSEGRAERLRASRDVRPKEGRARRYRMTVASAGEYLVIDSAMARVSRARRRIVAWASAVPKQVETIKRKKQVIEMPRLVMITLTYRDAGGWAPNDIRDYMLSVRKALKNRLLAYCWVCEMQKRGAPHYHVMLYVRRGTLIPAPDKSGMWEKGASKTETARTAFYATKYIGKEYQKELLPAGARMFAVWINENIIDDVELMMLKMSSLPRWFRDEILEEMEGGADISPGGWRRASGGGWWLDCTGRVYKSPWNLVGVEPIWEKNIVWQA